MAWTDCIARLTQAAGRALTDAEVTAIFERIHKAALDIKAGRKAPGDVGLGQLGDKLGVGQSQDQLIQVVAARAAADLLHEAQVRERQAYLQITKMAARDGDRQALRAIGLKPFDAIDGLLARDYSGTTNIESVEQRVAGVRADLKRRVADTWDALGDDWLGFFQNRDKMLTLVRALRGDQVQDAVATKGAKAFHEAAEEARQSFNAAGGDVGKLDDWGMPQHHSQEKVAAAGRDAWVDQILPLIDRSRYVDDLGRGWNDVEMRAFLARAWDTIATNGIANIKPGEFTGTGKRANRHAESRQIHFKDAESVLQYWETFGDLTVAQILDGHIDRMAKDIAFIEKMGPNPELTYQTLRDRALREVAGSDPTRIEQALGRARKSDNLFEYAAGKIKPTANRTLSNVADGIAALNAAGKLGGSMIMSLFGDKVTFEAVSHLNNIPAIQRWQTELATLNPANGTDRAALQRHGLMVDYIGNTLNRFYNEIGTTGTGGWSGQFKTTSGKFANAVMRLNGMNLINEGRKGAFGITLMDAIGSTIAKGKRFDQLDKTDARVLKNFGITRADWGVWQQAKMEDFGHGNQHVLTPEAIARITDDELRAANVIAKTATPAEAAAARREAIVKLLGAVNTESEFAVVTPGWRERSQFYGGLQRGTVFGEIARSVLQFKSFPWTAFLRSLDLVANSASPVGKAAMTAYIVTSTTLAGAMIMQVREVLAGKDPRAMADDDWATFWGQAFLQGGALGIYGDFLKGTAETRYGSGILETMAGPTIGPLLEMGLVQPMRAIRDAKAGKETNLGADTIQDLKGFIPANNLWYTKAAFDHLIWHQVMETVSPGYVSSMRSKTLQRTGQDWWWQPGELTPDRAPEFSEAVR